MKKTRLKKYSTKGLAKRKEKAETSKKLHEWFLEIWDKIKYPHCEECGKYLGKEPNSCFFDHLLEKSKYPELAFVRENIFICCPECHEAKTNGFPKPYHKQRIAKAKFDLIIKEEVDKNIKEEK